MPINPVPDRSDVIVGDKILTAKPSWLEFFKSIFAALMGWKRSYTANLTFDFPNIPGGTEATAPVAVPGARAGDLVLVTPKTHVAGLDCWGMVTADNTVTVVRANFTAGAIDPASDDFRVVVMQQ
jgi:hypothetical protein